MSNHGKWFSLKDGPFIKADTLDRSLKNAVAVFCGSPSHEESRLLFEWPFTPEKLRRTNLSAMRGVFDKALRIANKGDRDLTNAQISMRNIGDFYALATTLEEISTGGEIPEASLIYLADAPVIIQRISAYYAAKGGALTQAKNRQAEQSRRGLPFTKRSIEEELSRNTRALAGIQHLARGLLPVAKIARELGIKGKSEELPLSGEKPSLKIVRTPKPE